VSEKNYRAWLRGEPEQPRFTCPYCRRVSHHPQDVANRYCSCCGCPPLLPKDCEHTRDLHRRRREPAR